MVKWLQRICAFWNKIISLGEHDFIYRMTVESATYAHGWARQVIIAMQSLGHDPDHMFHRLSQTLLPLDIEHVTNQAVARWTHSLWTPARNAMSMASRVHQQGSLVRSVVCCAQQLGFELQIPYI